MDKGAWKATVHGVARVGHDLATTPPPPPPAPFLDYSPKYPESKNYLMKCPDPALRACRGFF